MTSGPERGAAREGRRWGGGARGAIRRAPKDKAFSRGGARARCGVIWRGRRWPARHPSHWRCHAAATAAEGQEGAHEVHPKLALHEGHLASRAAWQRSLAAAADRLHADAPLLESPCPMLARRLRAPEMPLGSADPERHLSTTVCTFSVPHSHRPSVAHRATPCSLHHGVALISVPSRRAPCLAWPVIV